MTRPLAWASLLSLLVAPADAVAYDVPPASPPECYGNCEQAPRERPSRSQESSESPEDRAQRQEAEEAAAEASRQVALREAQEALRESEASDEAREGLANKGAAVRNRARRFQEYSDELVRREENVRKLDAQFAPVNLAPAPAAPSPGPQSPPLSMKEYCRRLNAAAPPAQGLRASSVPALPRAPAEQPAFWASPRHGPGEFQPLLEGALQEAAAAAQDKAKKEAVAAIWKFLEGRADLFKSIHDAKKTYEKESSLVQLLSTKAFDIINKVAETVGPGGGTYTEQQHDEDVGSMVGDVLRSHSPPSLVKFLKLNDQWRALGEAP